MKTVIFRISGVLLVCCSLAACSANNPKISTGDSKKTVKSCCQQKDVKCRGSKKAKKPSCCKTDKKSQAKKSQDDKDATSSTKAAEAS